MKYGRKEGKKEIKESMILCKCWNDAFLVCFWLLGEVKRKKQEMMFSRMLKTRAVCRAQVEAGTKHLSSSSVVVCLQELCDGVVFNRFSWIVAWIEKGAVVDRWRVCSVQDGQMDWVDESGIASLCSSGFLGIHSHVSLMKGVGVGYQWGNWAGARSNTGRGKLQL